MIIHKNRILGVSHLEGRLPNQQEISDTGKGFKSSAVLLPLSPFPVCDYYTKCAELNIKCSSPCQTQRFFDKYGIGYLSLGIGSKI
jgi:hypothetical protein